MGHSPDVPARRLVALNGFLVGGYWADCSGWVGWWMIGCVEIQYLMLVVNITWNGKQRSNKEEPKRKYKQKQTNMNLKVKLIMEIGMGKK